MVVIAVFMTSAYWVGTVGIGRAGTIPPHGPGA